jgi:hypothetical protein
MPINPIGQPAKGSLYSHISVAKGPEGGMFGRKKGTWVNFEKRDPKAKIVRVETTCISTSAESAGHFHSAITNGRIVGVNDQITEKPQTSQADRELVPA